MCCVGPEIRAYSRDVADQLARATELLRGTPVDGALAVVTTPGFYEIKRGRTVGPLFD